jgi:FkbM family methyltransferase
MLINALARLVAKIPSPVKYRMAGLKPFYTSLMRLGGSAVRVETAAGTLNWKIDSLTSQQYVLGTYETYMQEAFLQFVRPGSVVFDIGANAGFHSLFCGLLVKPSGCVVAFEPNPESRKSLLGQVQANPELPVVALPFALSDYCGPAAFDHSKGHQSRLADGGRLIVEVTTIDSMVGCGHIPPPHIMKIDVEGYEEHVLRGSTGTLRQYHPVVLCDYNDRNTFDLVTRVLKPLGYRISAGPPVVASGLS